MKEDATETKALLNVKELYAYFGIGQTRARERLSDSANVFTVKIVNCLYAHRAELAQWLLNQIL